MSPRPPTLQPVDSKIIPRFAAIATFMRAQRRESARGLDIAMAGVPFDFGSSNRAGTRHGPAQMREMSRLIRRVHFVTKTAPFEVCRIADIGDAPVNPLDLMGSLKDIEKFFDRVISAGAVPLAAGGDHTIALPILRALAKRHGPLGMLQFDSHSDTHDTLLGHKYNHGTCFRRGVEEGVIDPKRFVQLGIRGTLYSADEHDWARSQGITIITIEDFFALGPERTVAETRRVLGPKPSYVTFDIDGLDPIYAPGTGAPEPGGLSVRDAQVVLRGLRGLNLVGADVNEVSPPLDPTGNTALVGANLMFEELCLLADALQGRRRRVRIGTAQPRVRGVRARRRAAVRARRRAPRAAGRR